MVQALHERLYTYGLYSSYIIYGLVWFGLWGTGNVILERLDLALNVYIALFLVYNFNPYNKKRVSEFGRGIAFSAGVLLLLTKVVGQFLKKTGEQDQIHAVTEFLYDFAGKIIK